MIDRLLSRLFPPTSLSDDSMERLRLRWNNEELEAVNRKVGDAHPFAVTETVIHRPSDLDVREAFD